jgi:hypothetical protein
VPRPLAATVLGSPSVSSSSLSLPPPAFSSYVPGGSLLSSVADAAARAQLSSVVSPRTLASSSTSRELNRLQESPLAAGRKQQGEAKKAAQVQAAESLSNLATAVSSFVAEKQRTRERDRTTLLPPETATNMSGFFARYSISPQLQHAFNKEQVDLDSFSGQTRETIQTMLDALRVPLGAKTKILRDLFDAEWWKKML